MQSASPRRFSTTSIAFISIAVVVVIVVALVIVKVTSSSGSSSSAIAPTLTPASPTVLRELTGVTPAVMDAVGVPSSSLVSPPTLEKHQPALKIDGKPGAFGVFAEFCPYCGAERWPTILAFSKFGTFTGLKETTSSPWDTDPDTPTFSFYGSHYKSNYLTFQPVENESNDTNGLGTRKPLEPLTAQQTRLENKYSRLLGLTSQGYPFMDLGNELIIAGPSYDPATLAGLNQNEVAANLDNPKSAITQSIVGTANYLVAGLCSMTGQQPSSVCSISAVTKAAKALGLS